MNEILQKRIEEVARHYALEKYPWQDGFENWEYPIRDFIKGATFALQNQWINVEEDLPKDFEKVFFRAIGKNDCVCYGTGYVVKEDWYTDIQSMEQSFFKFKITNWMAIPSLEGGEK